MSEDSTLPSRIKLVMKHFGINPEDKKSEERFAEKWQITKRSLYNYMTGAQSPDFKVIRKFASNFREVNLNWFVSGHGNMLNDGNEAFSISREPIEAYGKTIEDKITKQVLQLGIDMVTSYDSFIKSKEKFTEMVKTHQLA
jgi:hypothetical protein